MKKNPPNIPPPPPPVSGTGGPIEWAQSVGLIVNNTLCGYWLSKNDTELGINESYKRLEAVLLAAKEVSISAFKDTLQVNEEEVPEGDMLLDVLLNHMVSCDITDFSVSRGLTRPDYGRFIDFLCLKPHVIDSLGGFSKLVSDAAIPGVRVVKAVYKRVSENETVVSQAQLEAAGAGMGEALTRQILELLGRDDVSEQARMDVMALITQHPARMAEVILDTVKSEAKEEDPLAVSDCVRRAFDRLVTDPSLKTQKGKKSLARMLTQVESELVETLGADSETAKALHEAVESMQDELQMEAIAAEYVKKRKAIEASEERILRYMKNKGLDNLQGSEFGGKLAEMGLDANGLNGFSSKMGVSPMANYAGVLPPPIPGVSAFTSLTVEHLVSLIDHIDKELTVIEKNRVSGATDGKDKARAVAATITEANRDLQKVLTQTEDKVRELVLSVQEDDARVRAMEAIALAKGEGPRIPRGRLMEMLAEIVQEICQPIAVITCSIDLILTRILGEVTTEQLDILDTAKESASRTMVIIEQLKELTGMPETRMPDQRILGNMYRQGRS